MGKAPNHKPIITVACLCEKVLSEKDNVLSAIRIVDTFTLPSAAFESEEPILLTILLSMKNGDVRGDHDIAVSVRRPSGSVNKLPKAATATFGDDGPTGGYSMVMQLPLKVSEEGYHWIEMTFDDDPLTKIPFRLRSQPEAETAPEAKT